MNDYLRLTDSVQPLIIYANFEAVCALPSNEAIIRALMAEIIVNAPDFFRNNPAFDMDGFAFNRNDTDFDHMVNFLKSVYVIFIHNNSYCECFEVIIDQYGLPWLSNIQPYEAPNFDDLTDTERMRICAPIFSMFDALSDSIDVSFEIHPKAASDATAYVEQAKARANEWAATLRRVQQEYGIRVADQPVPT